MLRAYDYSLEDATSAMISFGDQPFEEKLQQKLARTEAQILKLKREMQILEDLQTLSQSWREKRSFICVEEWDEEVFFLEQLHGWLPIVDEERNHSVKLLTAELPITFYGMVLDRKVCGDQMLSSDCNVDSSGIFWRTSDCDVLPESVRNIIWDRKFRWKTVLHGILQFSRDDPEELIVFRKLRELLTNADLALNYEISSDIALRILPVSLPSAEEFLEVIIPIEKKITEVKSE